MSPGTWPGEAPAPTWRPLLQGDDATAAVAALTDLSTALWRHAEAVATDPLPPPTSPVRPEHSSLDGLAGLSLFLAYLGRAFPSGSDRLLATLGADPHQAELLSGAWQARGLVLLDRAIEASAAVANFPPALFGGFVGVAWLIEHLSNLDPAEMGPAGCGPGADRAETASAGEAGDPGDAIAEVLRRYLGQTPWRRDFDLVSGLVGCGAWALERMPRPGGENCLAQVVMRLAETAERRQGEVTWVTPARLLPPDQRAIYPNGNYNLGVAHGVPGAIGLLAGAWEAGVERPLVLELLAGAVDWLSRQKLPAGSASAFPYNVAPGVTPKLPGVAWCYGDLGIAVVLLAAARRVGMPAWEEEALAVARTAAARRPPRSGRLDACLCHGAAGNGHLFNRLYQATGDPLFAAAARWWLHRTLTLRQPGAGLAGFRYWDADERDELALRPTPGFLNGAVGTGLALLAAIAPVPPEWDRLLLVSIPAC